MILVTGATGTVGRQVVSQLRAQGERVRAVTRDPSVARLPEGVDVVMADLADPTSLEPLLHDVQAVFLVWPFTAPDRTAQLAPHVVEVLTAQSRRIVYLSAQAAADRPDSFWAIVEQTIARSSGPWTFLRPTGFAKNALMWAPQIKSGNVVRWPYGQASRSLIHEDDIAAVAVKALTEDEHDQATYVLSGAATLTQAEQVGVIGDVLHRSLRWDEMPADEARIQLAEAFPSAAFAESALATWAAFVDHPEQVTSTIEEITGHPARSFHQWVVDHAGDFR